MSAIENLLIHYTAVFTLVLARVGGLVATAPLLSNTSFPAQVQGLLAVTLAFLITPLQITTASATPDNLIEFTHTLILETLVGVLLGAGVTILISGVQLAGQTVSQLSGVSMADVVSPGFDESVSAYTQLMYMVTLSVFVAIGGHRLMIEALLSTFEWAPPGRIQLGDDFFNAFTTLASQSFDLGLRAGGPLLIAMFLATLALALISRTLPQINTIAVGFNINAILLAGVLFITMGSIAWTFQEPMRETIAELATLVHSTEESVVSGQ